MRLENISFDESLVPQQPGVAGSVNGLEKVLETWNPACKKNLAYIYQFQTGSEGGAIEILPDNCFTFVFVCGDAPHAYLAGPVPVLTRKQVEPDSTYFAFKPFSLLGTNLAKMAASKDAGQYHIPLEHLFRELSIVERINQAGSLRERTALFMEYARKHLINPEFSDSFIEHLELLICRRRGQDRISDIVDKTGYTDRHCRGRFKDRLGVSIKTYSDIIRVQNVVRMLVKARRRDVFDAAFENKFYTRPI